MERIAYICQAKDCGPPPRRVFLFPSERDRIPRCCGKPMQRQANVPYTKPDTSKPPGKGRRLDAKAKAS